MAEAKLLVNSFAGDGLQATGNSQSRKRASLMLIR
jgi:hypothetical protein